MRVKREQIFRKKIIPKRESWKQESLDDTKIDKDGKTRKKALCSSVSSQTP